MVDTKFVHIIGGGTLSHVRAHLAIAAPAYGRTARDIHERIRSLHAAKSTALVSNLHLTKMADSGYGDLETNDDVAALVAKLVKDGSTKIIFFNPAMVDFAGEIGGVPSGKYADRLHTRSPEKHVLQLSPTAKVAKTIRKDRKDIFLVTFKTTCGATEQEQYLAGLNLLKESSSNLVLANDIKTRVNMIITPEEASYHVTTDRQEALDNLMDMALLRSHLTFTRSTVVNGESVPWSSDLVPSALRTVVDYCVEKGAYKPFRGATVGHFAVKVNDNTFLTSKRKTNFNDLDKIGLVKVTTDGPDSVIAYGARPSVGGQSQRIVFTEHPELDCIVHAHVPIKPDSQVPQMSQREFECGSHQCGQNTSTGLKSFGNLKAVYLKNHGPNIVFHRSIDPQEVIKFIDDNFDLSGKTGGYKITTIVPSDE